MHSSRAGIRLEVKHTKWYVSYGYIKIGGQCCYSDVLLMTRHVRLGSYEKVKQEMLCIDGIWRAAHLTRLPALWARVVFLYILPQSGTVEHLLQAIEYISEHALNQVPGPRLILKCTQISCRNMINMYRLNPVRHRRIFGNIHLL